MRQGTSIGALVLGLAAGASIAGCEMDEPVDVSTGSGATAGPLTISGHLRDPAGNGVIGGRIALDGATRAVRFSNFTGGFSFHVEPGSYRLVVSGDCRFEPASLSLRDVTAGATVEIVAASAGCFTSTVFFANPNGEELKVEPIGSYTGASVSPQADADHAVAYLDVIASEVAAYSIRRVLIAGHPALERLALLWHAGLQGAGPGTTMLHVDTAIAAGEQIVRFNTQLQPDAPADTIDSFLAAGRSFTPEQIPELHTPPPPPR